MQKIVVDSSVIVKWLNQDNELHLDKADDLLNDVQLGLVELMTPELAKYEVGNVLIKGKSSSVIEADLALEIFYALPITFASSTLEMAEQTCTVATKFGMTYYDASFVVLAKSVNVPLVTANSKHQGKARGVNVVSLENYSFSVLTGRKK